MPKAKKQKVEQKLNKENLDKEEEEVEEEQEEVETKKTMKAKLNVVRKLSRFFVGAHVSAAKGPKNAILNASELGCNSFALFLKNQRTWSYSPMTEQSINEFKNHMKQYSYDYKHVLPHGSYLINLANPDKEKRQKSYDAFLDDLKRCELLDIEMYNFHPGSTVGECTINEAIYNISECINNAINETKSVIIVIENMAGQGNVIGANFEELASIIDKVKDKNRIGVCIDTCHAFAAGYDLRSKNTFNKVFDDFDRIVGLKYLKAFHLNDSKGDLGCGKDRHENIGKGKLGLECFRLIMNDCRFENMPLILETPPNHDNSIYKQEIELLYSLCKE